MVQMYFLVKEPNWKKSIVFPACKVYNLESDTLKYVNNKGKRINIFKKIVLKKIHILFVCFGDIAPLENFSLIWKQQVMNTIVIYKIWVSFFVWCLTSISRIFRSYGDVTIDGEGHPKLGLHTVTKEGVFIMLRLLWHAD